MVKDSKKTEKRTVQKNQPAFAAGGNSKIGQKMKVKSKPKKEADPEKRFIAKILFFSAINVLSLVLLIFFLQLLPEKSLELRTQINTKLKAEATSKVNLTELQLDANSEKADGILKLFPDDEELVEFIKEVEKLKANGVVITFTFADSKAVIDRTGSAGLPFVIEFRGTWEQIDNDLVELQKIPFVLRPITIVVQQTQDESIINYKYGGFLYVDESF